MSGVTESVAASEVQAKPVSRRPKVLFVTPILRHPAAGGPYLRIENSIKALTAVSDLHICSRTSRKEMGGLPGLRYYRALCTDLAFAPSSSLVGRYANAARRRLNSLLRRLVGADVVSDETVERIDHAAVIRLATAIRADVIWLGYGNISYPLLKAIKAASSIPVVLDTDSVWSRFVIRGLPYAASETEAERISAAGRAKEEEERWGTELADITTAVSEIDAEYYGSLAARDDQVRIFANVIDLASYQVAPPPPAGFKTPALHLAGTFGPRSPMDDAARWLITEVMPLVWNRRPDAHLYIVGRGSKETLADILDGNVTIAGELPSVLPYLCNASAALVPLRYESGTRFKILEAGACGIPIVSTTLGAEGIPVTNGEEIWIADDPTGFADAILRVLDNPADAARVADKMRALVRRDYALDTLAAQASSILDSLVK